MKTCILPLCFALTALAPLGAQAQSLQKPVAPSRPTPQTSPQNLTVQPAVGGNITAKNPQAIAQAYGKVKCSQLKVTLQQSNPNDVAVSVPGGPKSSKFPDSYAPVTVQATGNHLALGCKFAVPIPSGAGQQAYLTVQTPDGLLRAMPQGWQNPMPLPKAGVLRDLGRNFVVEAIEIK